MFFDPLPWFCRTWLTGWSAAKISLLLRCWFWLCTSARPIVGRTFMKNCSASFCIFLHNGTYAGKLHENNSAVFGAQNHGSGSPLGMAFDGQAAASKPLLQGLPAVSLKVVQLCQFEWHNHHVLNMSAGCYRIKSILTFVSCCFILYMSYTDTISNNEYATYCDMM
jgi:hypothetical protein